MTFTQLTDIIRIDMSKFKFTFTNIFLWVGIISSALLIENVAFLTSNPTGPLPDTYFYMLFVLAMSSYLCVFLFEHIYNKTHVDYFLVGILTIFLVTGVVAISAFKKTNFFPDNPEMAISFTMWEQVRLCLAFFDFIVTLYAILFIFNKNHFSIRSLWFLYVIVMGIAYFTMAYSFIAETQAYADLFTGKNMEPDIKSVFWNTNMYSGMLLMGMGAAMVLNIIKKNVFSYVSIVIFWIELLIACSVLNVIIGTFFLLIYFLIEIVISSKRYPRRSFLFFALYLLFLTTLICLFAFSIPDMLGPVSKFFIHVYQEILNLNYSTFSNRTVTWGCAMSLLMADPFKLAFGYGYGIAPKILPSYMEAVGINPVNTTHNGAIQIFLNYGIVGIIVYSLFFIYFIYSGIRLLKGNRRTSLIFMLVGLVLIGYSIGESVIYYNSNVQGLLVGTVFYLPLIMKYKHARHKEVERSIFAEPYNNFALDTKHVVSIASTFIMSLLCAFTPIFFFACTSGNRFFYSIALSVEISLAGGWLLLPYLVGQWHKDTDIRHFWIRFILNVLFIGITFGSCLLLYFNFEVSDKYLFRFMIPTFFVGIILIDAIYYSIIRKASFKDYLATFKIFWNSCPIATVISVAGGILLMYFYRGALEHSYLTYLITGVYIALLFYSVNFLYMFKDFRYNVEYINNVYLTHIKRQILIEYQREAYYV